MLRHPEAIRPRSCRDAARRILPLVLAALPFASTGPARAQDPLQLPPGFVDELVISGFDQSTGMAFLPDGRFFVVEKITARVRLIVDGAVSPNDPLLTVPGVEGALLEQGLLGIAADAGWPNRPYLYVHYTHTGSAFIRVSRFTVGGDLGLNGDGDLSIDPATRYDVLTDIPDATPYHNGGTLRFGTDGMLYVSTGDDNTACLAQNLTSLAGKILRIDVSRLPHGSGGPPAKSLITPPDNPLVSHPHPNARLVLHWGFRNPYRFSIDRWTGALVIGDVGLETQEEIDYLPMPGRNLQWPIYEGDVPGSSTCAGVDSSTFAEPIHVYGRDEGFAVVAGVQYRQPLGATEPFPSEYDGDIFFNDFFEPWVRRLKKSGGVWSLEPTRGMPSSSDWGFGNYWISDWHVGSDGSLWYLRLLSQFGSGPGEVHRIRYLGTTSAPGPAPSGLELGMPHPSPSRGEVRVDYALAAAGPVSLAVFEVAGRRVRDLVARASQPAGPGRATWDGCDDAGRPVAAGIYRLRLAAAGQVLERRLVRVR